MATPIYPLQLHTELDPRGRAYFEYNFLPKHLAKANYESYHIGKWHLGFHTPDYTPVARGFNHSWGFFEGSSHHWTRQCAAGNVNCKVPGRPGHGRESKLNWDLWSQSTYNFPGMPLYEYNATDGDKSCYNGVIFSQKAVEFIQYHDMSRSMFMYLALDNTHMPIEAPDRFISMYDFNNSEAPLKNTFFAMVSVVDETVKNVTEALKAKGMWDNTVFVWGTDNGSPAKSGSNHPLRGGKTSNWEGGIRVPTFVSGGALPKIAHGRTLDGLVHVSDWYSTFSAIAGLGPEVDPSGPSLPDSINVWPYLAGKIDQSPRTEIIYDHRMFTNASKAGGCKNVHTYYELSGCNSLGAIRMGRHKLLVGPEGQASWFGAFSPNSTAPDIGATACWGGPCLFDVVADPGEHNDLAASRPDLVAALWKRFNRSNSEPHPAKLAPPRDRKGFCEAVRSHGGWVAPWRSSELFV